MERAPIPPRPVQGPLRRSSIELATVTSLVAVALAYSLHRFANVGEMPIVLGTLVVASILGWCQPAARPLSRRALRPVPVPMPRPSVVTRRH